MGTMTEPAPKETVTLSKREYDDLCQRSEELAALEALGVDNWDGYEEAMQSLKEKDD